MSRPSPLTSQVSDDSGQKELEEKQEEVSVVISPDPINVVIAGSGGRPPLLSSIGKDEPLVTRRELWSYYRQLSFFLLEIILNSLSKFTTMEIMYVN